MPNFDSIYPTLIAREAVKQVKEQPHGRISKMPAGPWEKTVHVVKKILISIFVFVGTVLGNIATLGIPTAISLYSDGQKIDTKIEIEAAQIKHILTALKCGLHGTDKWVPQSSEVLIDETSLLKEIKGEPNEDQRYFVREVIGLRHQIAELQKRDVTVGSLEKIYKQFQKLVKEPRFMTVFRDLEVSDHSAVNFLKILAAKFRSAKVSELLIQHAREELGELGPDPKVGGYSIGQTGEALAEYREKPSFKHNFLWAISHPFAWYHSCESQWLHKKYDSHESNPTYSVHEVEYSTIANQTIKAQFIAGPTPFNDPVYEQIFSKTNHELRFNIMDMSKKGSEDRWIQKMDRIANESNGHTQQVVWGFATKKKGGFLKPTQIDPLIDGYRDALLHQNACRSLESSTGVKVPETLLSEGQVMKACEHAKALIKDLNPDLTKKSARHAALVIVDTMMATGTMINYLEGLKDLISNPKIDEDMRSVHIAIACKQCFDRGPVYFAALMLFFRSLTNSNALSKEEFYKITGLPLFRAPLNEGREQIEGKFKVYEQLAQMLGPHMDKLAFHTQAFRAAVLS